MPAANPSRSPIAWVFALVALLILAGCGQVVATFTPEPGNSVPVVPSPAPSQPAAMPTALEATATPSPDNSVPVVPSPTLSHPASTPTTAPGDNGPYPLVGHAPDLSWIAGQVQVTRIQGGCVYLAYGPNPEDRVNPQGTEWANAADAQVATDGAYVVVFGHLTEAGEPREMCPGTPYTVTHVQPNATGTGPGLSSPTPIPTAADAGTPHVIVGTSVPGGPILGPPLVPRTDTPVPDATPTPAPGAGSGPATRTE